MRPKHSKFFKNFFQHGRRKPISPGIADKTLLSVKKVGDFMEFENENVPAELKEKPWNKYVN